MTDHDKRGDAALQRKNWEDDARRIVKLLTKSVAVDEQHHIDLVRIYLERAELHGNLAAIQAIKEQVLA